MKAKIVKWTSLVFLFAFPIILLKLSVNSTAIKIVPTKVKQRVKEAQISRLEPSLLQYDSANNEKNNGFNDSDQYLDNGRDNSEESENFDEPVDDQETENFDQSGDSQAPLNFHINEDESSESKGISSSEKAEKHETLRSNDPLVQKLLDDVTYTIPGLTYLGVGYDVVFGNPLGDPKTMLDPGYKPPVVHLLWQKTLDGVSNDLKNLQPLGAWIRDEIACRRAETVETISTMNDYRNSLSVDASVSGSLGVYPISFSASVGFKSAAQNISKKDSKTFMIRTYCNRYAAGLNPYPKSWLLKEPFVHEVSTLPSNFDGMDEESQCSADVFKNDENAKECMSSVKPWMEFFKRRGTHIVDTIHLGGKMTHQVQVSTADLKAMNEKGVSVSAEVSAFSFSGSTTTETNTASNDHRNNYNMNKTTIVLGGHPPEDVTDPSVLTSWSRSVASLPMPVKINLTPFSSHPEFSSLKEAYYKALEYYGLVYGMTQTDLEAISGKKKALKEILLEAEQIGYAGPPPGYALCGKDKVILFGFAIHFSPSSEGKMKAYHIHACNPGKEKCDGLGTQTEGTDDVRIWAMCGDEPLATGTQVVAESDGITTVAQCPQNMVVAFGFGFSIGTKSKGPARVDVYPCRNGSKECTKQRVMFKETYTKKNFIWMVCVDKVTPGFNELESFAVSNHRGKCREKKKVNLVMGCKNNGEIIAGFGMELHSSFNEIMVRRSLTNCQKGANKCSVVSSGYCHAQRVFFLGHYQSMIGFMICAKDFESNKERKVLDVLKKSQLKTLFKKENTLKKGPSVTPKKSSAKRAK